MDEIKIDLETAKLVVDAYQKINTLKRVFNEAPFLKTKEILESGAVLSNMLNQAFEQTTKKGLVSKLFLLNCQLESLTSHAETFQNFHQKQEIAELFEQLKADVSLLHSKINE